MRNRIQFGILGVALLAVACGGSNPVAPLVPSPEPSATPGHEKLVVVGVTGVQNGKEGINEVQAFEQFKIDATANACYLDRVQVACNGPDFSIPYWSQKQRGGERCDPSGAIDSASVAYVCPTVGKGREFEACALDFDKREIGCGRWTINVTG